MFNQKKSKLMQTKGQLMKSLHTAFSFAPPSILSLTICILLSEIMEKKVLRLQTYKEGEHICITEQEHILQPIGQGIMMQ